ncbi:MAG: AmmeMemoRadiSam system protein B [Acidimicrobiia bacterium]
MSTRRAAVAGTFYPSDPVRLEGDVRAHLDAVGVPQPDSSVRMLIVPHAGYIYSGPVAARAYRCLENVPVERVVLLGPAHYVPFAGMTLPGADGMETPLGIVSIDADACRGLLADSLVTEDPEAHRREHSLEVQLPFLQVVTPGVSVVPLLTGAITPRQGADVVAPLLDDKTLLLVSSDLSHYYDSKIARRLDAATAAAIVRLDWAALEHESACGRTAIQIALELATRLGYRVTMLDLRNSGDTAGPSDRVVGYGAFVLGL